ncbi:hypothetical protein AAF712_001872 [Marasmius tenuissimus]|uniref:Hyaluronan/mRNA-binding protein domain-containing protein n=1 Tax=Marasmius tenuissimus TaxID=585030 RepID=A0ABR3ABM2_9AGAR
MTRTERSAFPRAVNRDRSLSKSGLERSLRKDGGGAHNWGRLEDELDHEYDALDDDIREDEEASSSSSDAADKPVIVSPSSSMTEQEVEAAKQFRKHAFKKGESKY